MELIDKIKKMIEKVEKFKDKIGKNKILQKNVWENKKTEIPIILNKQDIEIKNYPDFNLKESFYNPEKMLYMQLKGIINIVSEYSDACPSVRFNFGTGFIPSIFGLESEIFEDKMPWLKKHLSKEEIKKFKFDDFEKIENMGLMQKVKEYFEVYKEYLTEDIKIYLPDTQGPFDIVHLIRGDEIFTDIYDDLEFFKFLLEISTFVYIKTTEKLKQIIGEDFKKSYHGGCYYIEKGGIRICEDSTTLLSPKHIEIVLNYTQKCLKYFGGGWVHFCGKAEHLFNMACEIPELTGINFGNPEKYDFNYIFKKLNEKNKVYLGNVPRERSETWKDYLKRVYEICEGKNLIFISSLKENEKVEEVYEYWRILQ
ncbi:MAG: hypothetical protein NC827_05440 [Candidatus Omnitrophica bacterium]|nr:hypothetical protein [Candidatus Omnitrophota bacterium]